MFHTYTHPPGPKGHFLLGVMPEYNRDALGFMTRCAREYGDVVYARFLYVRSYFLNHPDYVEYVLATNYRNFIKPMSLRTPFFRRLVGNGLVSSEGDFWRRQRRLAQPAFHRERIAGYAKIMVEYAERLLETWQNGETRDLHQDMMRLTQDIVVRSLFSAEVSGDLREMGEALDVLITPFGSQATLRWILDNRLPTRGNRRFHRAARLLDGIVQRIIDERRASGVDRGDLLSMLLHAQDQDGSQMTDIQLRDEVMTLFLAGYETNALALTWSWYLLSRHPEVEARLLAEIDEELQGRRPTLADVPRLRYAEMIVKESMRLYPPAYAVGREALRDCEIGGYRVPAGTQLFMFQWTIHRDPRFFDDPEVFNPDRWANGLAGKLPKYAYFPFGGGPRVCIGNSFAMMEAVLILATIARDFHLETAGDTEATILPTMTLRPRDGMNMVVSRRSERPGHWKPSIRVRPTEEHAPSP